MSIRSESDSQHRAASERVELKAEGKLLSEQEVLDYPMPPLLVDDLFVQRTLIQIAATYGVGKTFVALDLALSIAAARPTFLGKALHLEGPVTERSNAATEERLKSGHAVGS